MNRTIFILFLFSLSVACVPTKKEIILQTDQDFNNNATLNTPVKRHQARDYTYTLRPDDIISLKVSSTTPSEFDFFNAQSTQTVSGFDPRDPLLTGIKIEQDGTIPLPVVGKVEIAGLTTEDARAKIQEIVERYLETPTVDVKLLSFQYTILGEVQNEGRYTTYNPKLNILEALGESGGFTDYADRARVKIVRRENNEMQIAYVNVLEDDVLSSPYFYLRPDDVISVAPLGAKNWRINNVANVGVLFSGISALTLLMLRWNN